MRPLREWSGALVLVAVLAWLILVPMIVVALLVTILFAGPDTGGLGVGIDLLHISWWFVGAALVGPPLGLIAYWYRARKQL